MEKSNLHGWLGLIVVCGAMTAGCGSRYYGRVEATERLALINWVYRAETAASEIDDGSRDVADVAREAATTPEYSKDYREYQIQTLGEARAAQEVAEMESQIIDNIIQRLEEWRAATVNGTG